MKCGDRSLRPSTSLRSLTPESTSARTRQQRNCRFRLPCKSCAHPHAISQYPLRTHAICSALAGGLCPWSKILGFAFTGSTFDKQHFLNFLPLPQLHGSLRPSVHGLLVRPPFLRFLPTSNSTHSLYIRGLAHLLRISRSCELCPRESEHQPRLI
jgi:hypothetical protein